MAVRISGGPIGAKDLADEALFGSECDDLGHSIHRYKRHGKRLSYKPSK